MDLVGVGGILPGFQVSLEPRLQLLNFGVGNHGPAGIGMLKISADLIQLLNSVVRGFVIEINVFESQI